MPCCSLVFVLGVQGCVVAHFEEVNVLVGVIVEEYCGASLALEVNAKFLLTGHLEDLDLNLGAFVDGLGLLLSVGSEDIDLLGNLEVELPCCV